MKRPSRKPAVLREAERLRKGIERLIEGKDKPTLSELRKGLRRLIDGTDAVDSLAYLEHAEKELQQHVRNLLEIIDENAGYMSPQHQHHLREARKATGK